MSFDHDPHVLVWHFVHNKLISTIHGKILLMLIVLCRTVYFLQTVLYTILKSKRKVLFLRIQKILRSLLFWTIVISIRKYLPVNHWAAITASSGAILSTIKQLMHTRVCCPGVAVCLLIVVIAWYPGVWFYWMFYDHFSARSLLAKLGRWGWWWAWWGWLERKARRH